MFGKVKESFPALRFGEWIGRQPGAGMANEQEAAETLALRALGWIAGQDDVLAGFMAASGIGPQDLGAAAGQAEFLGAVLDYVLGDEDRLVAFCDAAGLDYGAPMAARRALPGGREVNWT